MTIRNTEYTDCVQYVTYDEFVTLARQVEDLRQQLMNAPEPREEGKEL